MSCESKTLDWANPAEALILGLGASGRASAELLAARGWRVKGADTRTDAALAEALRRVGRPMNVLAAPGAGGDALERSLSGSLHRVVRTGYRPQSEFDRLLWASDAAVVRGEDSFVRAQLAGIPFLWSIYPTEDGAHFVKLDAWLGRLEPFFADKVGAERYEALARGWVKGEPDLGALTDFLEGIEDRAAFESWGASIRRRGDLAVRMLERAELGE